MNIQPWIKAFRLRTLPLALASICMGSFLAGSNGFFQWKLFLLCVSTTIFLQILSNLANDYGDSVHGADSAERKGPARAVQSGVITAKEMKIAILIFVSLSLISGLCLLFISFGFNWSSFLFFFGLGILSILAAIAYTVGRRPYGYMGLGDISVLLFFGLVGVLGSYYLYAQHINWFIILPAISCGLFSVGVLNINNIRDIDSDVKAGKYSIPVRIGKINAARYHWFLIFAGLLSACIYLYFTYRSPWQFLFLVSAPLFIRIGLAVQRRSSEELDPYLKQMAITTLLFVMLFGIGLFLK